MARRTVALNERSSASARRMMASWRRLGMVTETGLVSSPRRLRQALRLVVVGLSGIGYRVRYGRIISNIIPDARRNLRDTKNYYTHGHGQLPSPRHGDCFVYAAA
jgi:hypothetical protein